MDNYQHSRFETQFIQGRLLFRSVLQYGKLGLLALLLVGGVACDQQVEDEEKEQREAEVTSQEVSSDQAAQAREFWTTERMQAAEPLTPSVWESHEGTAPPSFIEPDVPGPNVDMRQRGGSPPEEVDAQQNQFGSPETLGLTPKRDTMVYDASRVSTNHTQYPYRTVGKVFFRKGENLFVCSASVIASENRSVVWTAGHCVTDGGEEDWHDQWIFVPAYDGGAAPLGRWGARVKTTFLAWHSNRNRNYDLGAVVVERRDGRPIASVTGSLGWMFNGSRNQDWRELGYPASGGLFSGGDMWQCSAPYWRGGGVSSNPGPVTSAIDCDMTGGASGGPWVVALENCPSCYINSVTSWGWWRRGHADLSTQLAGPYHGTAAFNLLRFAEGM